MDDQLREYKVQLERENESKLQDLREEIKRDYEKQREDLQMQQSHLEDKLKKEEFDEDSYRE